MASGQIFSVSTRVAGETLSLELTYDHQDFGPTQINFNLKAKRADQTIEITAIADLFINTVVPTFNLSTPSTGCLTACAGAALVKALIECFNTDINQYISCLQSKGLSTASDIAACALSCFTGP